MFVKYIYRYIYILYIVPDFFHPTKSEQANPGIVVACLAFTSILVGLLFWLLNSCFLKCARKYGKKNPAMQSLRSETLPRTISHHPGKKSKKQKQIVEEKKRSSSSSSNKRDSKEKKLDDEDIKEQPKHKRKKSIPYQA